MKFVPAVKNKGRKRGGEETMKTWNGGVSLSRGVGARQSWGFLSNLTALSQLSTAVFHLGLVTKHGEG